MNEQIITKRENKKENREVFLKRLEGKFSPEQIENIDFAYDIAKESHRPQSRDSGERYFEHPRAGCLIMLDELGLYDHDLLVSFLLHDTGEDTPIWGNITESYDTFAKKAHYRLTKIFNESVADTVIRLTKPAVDNKRFFNKEQVFEFYINELQESEDAVIGKMVDRLHNLRSLVGNKPEKIQKQIKETEEVYLPIFESIQGEKKEYAERLVSKINRELQLLKQEV